MALHSHRGRDVARYRWAGALDLGRAVRRYRVLDKYVSEDTYEIEAVNLKDAKKRFLDGELVDQRMLYHLKPTARPMEKHHHAARQVIE